MTTELNDYWVTFTGRLLNDDDTPCAADDTAVHEFVRDFTACLMNDPDSRDQAVSYNERDGELIISAVFRGSSGGNALDYAQGTFTLALRRLGMDDGDGFPDGKHKGWNAHQLLRRGAFVELVGAAA